MQNGESEDDFSLADMHQVERLGLGADLIGRVVVLQGKAMGGIILAKNI
jgi:hypothetical protein